MFRTRSEIVPPAPATRPLFPDSGFKARVEEFFAPDGPWLIKQTFERREAEWMTGILGGYFPSLPRVLDYRRNEWGQIKTMLGTSPGESLPEYCQRVGPLPVSIACVLIWRLAAELEALESWMPEAAERIDPLMSQLGLWQQEFLHLFVDRFAQGTSSKRGVDLPSQLLKLCGFLLNGSMNPAIDNSVAVGVPSSLLTPLRQLQHTGKSPLTLKQLKGVLLVATADVTRGIRGTNLMSQLIVNPRWYPKTVSRENQEPLYRKDPAGNHLSMVRLSRFLAHRNKLNPSEITLLLSQLEEVAALVPEEGLSLDPQHIFLQLPSQRETVNDTKFLDARLDSFPEFSIALQSCSGCLTTARSPVVFREAPTPDTAYVDLRGKLDDQLGRLSQTLQDGTFSLSGYDMGSASEKALPGLFSCYLGVPPPDKKALKSLKSAVGQTLSSTPTSTPLPQLDLPFPAFNSQPKANLPHEPMKMILITAGSGGTGKSTVARLIYELANFENRDDVAMFDCDALGNRDFQKISPEKIESMPIDNVDTMRRLVETAMERKLVLADLPASCQDVLARDLNPDIIQSLRADEGLHWLPIHLLTAKAAAVPAINQWRTAVFGECPSVIVVSMKDGPVTSDMLEEIARPQDIILRMPVLDQSLASALDASSSSWADILDGKAGDAHRMFSNPLVKRQLRFKRKECEDALFPLLRLIVNNQQQSTPDE